MKVEYYIIKVLGVKHIIKQLKHMKKSTQNIIVFILSGILFAFASVYCYRFYQFDGSTAAFYLSILFTLGTLSCISAILLELFNPTK